MAQTDEAADAARRGRLCSAASRPPATSGTRRARGCRLPPPPLSTARRRGRRRVDDGGVWSRLLEHEHGGGDAVVRRQQLDLDLEDARGVGDGYLEEVGAIRPARRRSPPSPCRAATRSARSARRWRSSRRPPRSGRHRRRRAEAGLLAARPHGRREETTSGDPSARPSARAPSDDAHRQPRLVVALKSSYPSAPAPSSAARTR